MNLYVYRLRANTADGYVCVVLAAIDDDAASAQLGDLALGDDLGHLSAGQRVDRVLKVQGEPIICHGSDVLTSIERTLLPFRNPLAALT